MSDIKIDGGKAFPGPPRQYEPASGGMSLRDYFASIAMGQLCRNGDDATATAHYAYQYADAMIAERNK